MPEDKNCKVTLTSSTSDQKKKKKKKGKKNNSLPENIETPLAVSLPPETSPVSLLSHQNLSQLPKLRSTSKKDRESLAGSGRRSKKTHKESSPLRMTINKTILTTNPAQGYKTDFCVQAMESLRWEGVMQDPQDEAKRLEDYRTKRRQRYIAHREAVLKEAQDALRQTVLKEKKVTKALSKSDRHETMSSLCLNKL